MGSIGKIHTDGRIEKEFSGNGFIYKNLNAFEKQTDEVCYIPELDDNEFIGEGIGYTYKDFLKLATEFKNKNNVTDFTPEEIAYNLFETCDWQFPETEINQWEMHETYS